MRFVVLGVLVATALAAGAFYAISKGLDLLVAIVVFFFLPIWICEGVTRLAAKLRSRKAHNEPGG